jgi:rhodanese-related sulfurtransferase
VDRFQRTNDPNIYAVGDAAEVRHGLTLDVARIPLAGAANRHGRAAGEHAATGHAPPASRVLGTAIVRVFGLDVGVTGLGRRAAEAAGYDVDTAIVHPNDHAAYYPGAHQMHLMLVYDKRTGKVLGAQAAGPAGIDKRLDVIATVIHFGGTLDDLASLDLSYAPQFSGAKDPVHFAAFVADNQRREICPGVDFPEPSALVLDVRTKSEFSRGSLPGAVHIPVDELRERLGELDPSRSIAVLCHVGIRGHAAVRILLQNGFKNVRNVKGGYVQVALRKKALPKVDSAS